MNTMQSRGRPILLYLPGGENLAKKIFTFLDEDWKLMPLTPIYQKDGEMKTVLGKGPDNSVREADTFLVQTPQIGEKHSPQDLVMELLFGIDTLAGCGAHKKTIILPWYFYACQDKTRRRENLSASWLARAMTGAGATHVISVDVHNDAIEMAFNRRECTFNHLYTFWTLFEHLEKIFSLSKQPEKFIFSSLDVGGSARVQYISKHTEFKTMTLQKEKDYETAAATTIDVGHDIKGRTAIAIDDMVRSGSTVKAGIPALMKAGAKNVIIAATHADFCGECVDLLDKYHKEGILLKALFTDSFSMPEGFAKDHPWFEEVSLAKILADTVSRLHKGESVAKTYLDEPIA